MDRVLLPSPLCDPALAELVFGQASQAFLVVEQSLLSQYNPVHELLPHLADYSRNRL